MSSSNNNVLESLSSSSSSSSSPIFNNTESTNKPFWNLSWLTWILIFIVLGILGFNIFTYLAEGTEILAQISQTIVNFFNEILSWISGLFGNNVSNTAKQTVNVSATGAKAGIDVAANTTTSAINTISNNNSNTNTNTNNTNTNNTNTNNTNNTNTNNTNTNNTNTNNTNTNTQPIKPNSSYSTNPGYPLQTTDTGNIAENTLNKALNNATTSTTVQADDSYSSIQSNTPSGKSGWCFIGEDRGIRSCMQVGVNDQCMSGSIFPTNDVCINPNLRV